MSITEMIMIFGLKPMVICYIITIVLAAFKKESASFQFSVIWLSLFFIPISILCSYLIGLTLDFQVPFSDEQNFLAASVPKNDMVLLFSIAAFIGLYLLFYRWLGFVVLANSEEPLTDLSSNLSLKIKGVINANNVVHLTLKKSTRGNHVAYVWRTNFIGPHRLVLGASFFQLTDYQQECVLNHECAHIKRNDWLKSEFLFFICSIFWWVFPVWMLKKRADAFAEQACDDDFVEGSVSNGQSSKRIYSKLLMSLSAKANVSRISQSSAKHMTTAGSGSEFFNRVFRVLEKYVDRDPVSQKSVILLLLVMTLMCSPILLISIEFTPKQFSTYSSSDDFVVWGDFQFNAVPVNPIDESVPLYSGLPVFRKSVDYFSINLNSPDVVVKPQIEELFTQAEIEPAAFQNDLFLPKGSVQVTGFLPKRLMLPEFPESARQKKVSGEVTVSFSVGENGRVKDVEFIRSNPIGVFETSVAVALEQFWFESGVGGTQALNFYFQI